MREGTKTTPIWQKTYSYDFQPDLMQTKKEFLIYLQTWFDDAYWQRLQAIDDLPSVIDRSAYQDWLHTLAADCPEQIATANYYKTRWGV